MGEPPIEGPPEVVAEMRALMAETREMLKGGVMVPERIDPWWEGRSHEQTPEYLGRVLEEAGLPEMAARARLGHFDDFHAPAEVADGLELIRLVAELRIVAREDPGKAERLAAIENAARRGEFDATKAESDRWAASKSGQDVFGELVRSVREGSKVGRNEPCPCGSGVKYKRCCGAG